MNDRSKIATRRILVISLLNKVNVHYPHLTTMFVISRGV